MGVRLLLVAEGPGDPVPQALGDVVAALGSQHLAKVRLEIERLETRMAAVEVLRYLQTLLARQLTVEKMVETVNRLPAFVVDRFTMYLQDDEGAWHARQEFVLTGP